MRHITTTVNSDVEHRTRLHQLLYYPPGDRFDIDLYARDAPRPSSGHFSKQPDRGHYGLGLATHFRIDARQTATPLRTPRPSRTSLLTLCPFQYHLRVAPLPFQLQFHAQLRESHYFLQHSDSRTDAHVIGKSVARAGHAPMLQSFSSSTGVELESVTPRASASASARYVKVDASSEICPARAVKRVYGRVTVKSLCQVSR